MCRLPPIPTLILLALALGLAAWLRLRVGGVGIGSEQQEVLFQIRAQNVAIAAIVGAALALAGVLLQSLLRNPLASPDLLGLASGAGLGVMVAVYLSFLAGAGLADPGGLGASGAAVLGAGGALAVSYACSQRRGIVEPVSLVLIGVVVGLVCGAGITLLQHLLPDQGMAAGRLLVGALREDAPREQVYVVGGATLVCWGTSQLLAPSMDGAALGDDEARSIGVRLGRLRACQFVLAGALTAGAVVLAGPIGFIGLVAPHAMRALCGPSHRWLLPGAALLGAAMVVLADAGVASCKQLAPGLGRLPLSVLTAMVGGPFFIALLRKRPQEW